MFRETRGFQPFRRRYLRCLPTEPWPADYGLLLFDDSLPVIVDGLEPEKTIGRYMDNVLIYWSSEMKLYLVQHAEAASKDIDPDRPLTEEGRRDVQKVATFIKDLNLKVDLLWHSGKARAAQTAGVLAQAVEVRTKMTARDGLGPNDDVNAMRKELLSGKRDMMIVGHLPFLSKLASLLLTGDKTADTIAFQKGGIVAFEKTTEGQWQINWMVIPELLI